MARILGVGTALPGERYEQSAIREHCVAAFAGTAAGGREDLFDRSGVETRGLVERPAYYFADVPFRTRNADFFRANSADFLHAGHEAPTARKSALWRDHLRTLDAEMIARAAEVFARVAAEEFIVHLDGADGATKATVATIRKLRERPPARSHGGAAAMHHATIGPKVDPLPALESLQEELRAEFARSLVLWKKDRADLVGFGSELDRAVNMPGWTNIWTMPIQNRVDMLATGVNTSVGVRVLGRDLDSVVAASERIATRLKSIPGAADVVADPIRGKGSIEVIPNRSRAADLGVSIGDVNATVETALGGTIATTVIQGRERHPIRVRYARDARADEESVRDLLVPRAFEPNGRARFVRLAEVAEVRVGEGPATIKGEAGLLRNYVRLNVRGRSSSDLVADARKVVSAMTLPDGVTVEWTGQFEHEARAKRTLFVMVPVVVLLIFGVLYWTYRDLADALLMLMAVPGAIAGGVFFQWLLGYPFSVTVWVGYIACFGMATSTGIIMLVYLRDAVERAGGLEALTPEGLRRAVLDGAVHRLRPKLLTEGTTILGLAPMLWADGPGAEIIRPMAAPVLGGLLVADEVIDLFLPVLFYHVRRWRMARIPRDSRDTPA